MSYSSSEHISIAQDDRVLRLRFNRPEKKNAITRDMYSTLATAIERANRDSGVRVIFIEGSSDCFTSGNDLSDFMNAPQTGPDSSVGRFLEVASTTPKPLMAAVTGIAVGIGTTLLLHCDLAYASESAQFNMPFVNLGLVPEFGSSLLLPQLMGQRRAAELLMFGERFDAATALELGVINEIFPDETIADDALARAHQLGAQPPSALRQTKQLMKQAVLGDIAKQIEIESKHFAQMLTAPEAKEAFQAFLQKRKPEFSSFE
jgi:enoyl-CoA hydratase/carnithine racemase